MINCERGHCIQKLPVAKYEMVNSTKMLGSEIIGVINVSVRMKVSTAKIIQTSYIRSRSTFKSRPIFYNYVIILYSFIKVSQTDM